MNAAVTIRTARSRAGLSRPELARRAGTSAPTLLAYEAGTKVPQVDTLDRIVRAAGFALDVTLHRRADTADGDRAAKARELVDVLELAAVFPSRPTGPLRFPPFPRSASPAR